MDPIDAQRTCHRGKQSQPLWHMGRYGHLNRRRDACDNARRNPERATEACHRQARQQHNRGKKYQNRLRCTAYLRPAQDILELSK